MTSALVQQAREAEKPQEQSAAAALLGPQTQSQLEKALGSKIGRDRFVRAALTAFRRDSKIEEAAQTPNGRTSILGALFMAAQLGLEVGGPDAQAHLAVFKGEASLIIGYHGYKEMYYDAGASDVQADVVREADQFDHWADSEGGKRFIHRKSREPGALDSPIVAAWARVAYPDGGNAIVVMTKDELDKRRPAKDTPAWRSWPESMYMKGPLRELRKTARTSKRLSLAANVDETIILHDPERSIEEAHVEHVPTRGDMVSLEAAS